MIGQLLNFCFIMYHPISSHLIIIFQVFTQIYLLATPSLRLAINKPVEFIKISSCSFSLCKRELFIHSDRPACKQDRVNSGLHSSLCCLSHPIMIPLSSQPQSKFTILIQDVEYLKKKTSIHI